VRRSSSLPTGQSYPTKDQPEADDVKHLQRFAEQADCEQGAKQRDHVQEDAAAIGADQFDAAREADVGNNTRKDRDIGNL
jgi:hypothetical protein